MKKSYLILAAVAGLFASCSQEVLVDETSQNEAQKPFMFETFTQKVTRADEANSTNLYDFYKTFDVYGWKTVESTPKSVFSHVPVGHFTSDTQGEVVYATAPAKPSDEWGTFNAAGWFYENVRYWDKVASGYEFFAIAPYEATPNPSLTVASGDNNIAIGSSSAKYDISTEKNLVNGVAVTTTTGITPIADKKYFGFSKDYMLAEKSTTKNALVSLNFHHILTKLNVKVTKQDSYKGASDLVINEIKIANLKKTGYFTYNTNMTTCGWTSDGTYDLLNTGDYLISTKTAATVYSGYYWFQTLIFPQTLTCKAVGAKATATDLTDRYLYVKYTIGTEVFEAYYDLANAFGKTAADQTYEFAQGSEYTLNIKVGPDPIIFDATVTAWKVEDEVEHVVY